MKRPADQAKLLFFALLRSTATALATTGEKARSVVMPHQQMSMMTHNIQLRLATRTDVNAIQACNLACLPENYNSQFYCSHLRQWPELALVAEDVSHLMDQRQTGRSHTPAQQQQQQQQQAYSVRERFHFRGQQPQQEPKIVAYVLGKIETRPVLDFSNPTSAEHRVETLGHVTSLAVLKDYRRLGLAKSLMTQLHHHLEQNAVESCGLHVRASNGAACRLYQEDGYEIARVIPAYYQDGEDAYFMKKIIQNTSFSQAQAQLQDPNFMNSSNLQRQQSQSLFGRKIWKNSGREDLRLPRKHQVPSLETDCVSNEDDDSTVVSSSSTEVSSGASSISFGT